MFRSKQLVLALALCLPMLVFFAGYWFNHSADLIPTGFIQYDNVSYLAYGKQYLDHPEAGLQYANPFNDGDQYPRIYFQTQSLFFAFLLKIGVPASWILPLFTIVCSFFCFLLIIAIYDHLVKDRKNRTWLIWMFAWGGGLLVLSGILYHYTASQPGPDLASDLFSIDPEGGWWGLSLGRALFFSCEAYYHFLFLGCIYYLLKRKYVPALIAILLLTLSHPFTGIELCGILCFWVIIERMVNRQNMPWWVMLSVAWITAFHIWYYLVYLEQFPEHQSVRAQYSLTWGLRFYRMIPAYAIVGTMALLSLFHEGMKNFLSKRENRIFLSWFLVAFTLANHELFLEPRQPIHFTRGYIWTSLFLLGLPALKTLADRWRIKKQYTWAVLFTILMLLDNFTWIVTRAVNRVNHAGTGYITTEQQALFSEINKISTSNTLILSPETDLAYLSSVYTKAYPLYSHPYTTPYAAIKSKQQHDFFQTGKLDRNLRQKDILLILPRKDSLLRQMLEQNSWKQVYYSPHYGVYQHQH